MKKTCKGCKCYIYDSMWSARCELGYKLAEDKRTKCSGIDIVTFKPAEECPKPKTNDELYRVLKDRLK